MLPQFLPQSIVPKLIKVPTNKGEDSISVCVCVSVCVYVCVCVCVCVYVLISQLYLTLCDPRDCSPPDSSVHGIFQARILE